MRQDGMLIADAMSKIGTFPVGITKIQKDMKKVQDYLKYFKEKNPTVILYLQRSVYD